MKKKNSMHEMCAMHCCQEILFADLTSHWCCSQLRHVVPFCVIFSSWQMSENVEKEEEEVKIKR